MKRAKKRSTTLAPEDIRLSAIAWARAKTLFLSQQKFKEAIAAPVRNPEATNMFLYKSNAIAPGIGAIRIIRSMRRRESANRALASESESPAWSEFRTFTSEPFVCAREQRLRCSNLIYLDTSLLSCIPNATRSRPTNPATIPRTNPPM